ncbi:unnamed protein product [Phytophthora lilii]|uniref:Unnamed protein product n=1 Tax=Phytophthora lilii TaxID=2077276 RepID=A0A9W6WVP2_9STRA|nr:unnamed protein product [Phytophthora lilii]
MRLYTVLLATAVALLASNNVAAEKCTVKTTAPTATTATPVASTTSPYIEDASAASAFDTDASTTASAVHASQATTSSDASTESAFDTDASTTASAVDASQATTSDEDDGASDVDAASSVAASAATSASTAADADYSVTTTEVSTTSPTAASSATATTATSTGASTAASAATSTAASSATSTTTISTAASASSSSGFCTTPRVRITEVDVGETVENNEDEAGLTVVAIASLPSGGSRIVFQSGDNVIVRELDSNDALVNSTATVEVPLVDFADIHADDDGFVLLGTRDAEGGGGRFLNSSYLDLVLDLNESYFFYERVIGSRLPSSAMEERKCTAFGSLCNLRNVDYLWTHLLPTWPR